MNEDLYFVQARKDALEMAMRMMGHKPPVDDLLALADRLAGFILEGKRDA